MGAKHSKPTNNSSFRDKVEEETGRFRDKIEEEICRRMMIQREVQVSLCFALTLSYIYLHTHTSYKSI